jgi:hypothetical protein
MQQQKQCHRCLIPHVSITELQLVCSCCFCCVKRVGFDEYGGKDQGFMLNTCTRLEASSNSHPLTSGLHKSGMLFASSTLRAFGPLYLNQQAVAVPLRERQTSEVLHEMVARCRYSHKTEPTMKGTRLRGAQREAMIAAFKLQSFKRKRWGSTEGKILQELLALRNCKRGRSQSEQFLAIRIQS